MRKLNQAQERKALARAVEEVNRFSKTNPVEVPGFLVAPNGKRIDLAAIKDWCESMYNNFDRASPQERETIRRDTR